LFDTSYNATNGEVDTTGADNGRDKLDVYNYNGTTSSLMTSYVNTMNSNPFRYSFVHITDPDTTGHGSGWGSTAYYNTLATVNGYLGQIFNLVTTNPTLVGRTSIILTADHGGVGYDHSDPTLPLDYTIPFFVWGPDALAGADLYALNPQRVNPLTGRPTYAGAQPVRNGDAANLELDLLGLGPIPGSTLNAGQDLIVPEPATFALLVLSVLALRRR
jgi:hypothetical protein